MKLSFRPSSLLAAFVVGGGLLHSALPGRAQLVAFDNFYKGPGALYEGGSLVGDFSYIGYSERAIVGFGFTAAVGGKLDSVEVGMIWLYGPNTATLSLYSDVGGLPGTTPFETWIATNLGSESTILTSIVAPELMAGNNYFLVASAPIGTRDAWGYNSAMGEGLGVYSLGGSPFRPLIDHQGAFRVTVASSSAVPEPSTYGLFGAVALLGLAAWRRKAARR